MKDKIATRDHIVTDQGNGGCYCSNCRADLTENPSNTCLNCGYELIEGSIFINQGGSDF